MIYSPELYGSQFTLDGLTINAGTDENGVDYILTSESGWFASPATKQIRSDKPSSDGTWSGAEYLGGRSITLEFTVSAPSIYQLQQEIARVDGLCRDPDQLYTLTVTQENGTFYTLVKRDAGFTSQPISSYSVAFSIQLFAPDARIFSADKQTLYTTLATLGTGGVVYPVGYLSSTMPGANQLSNPDFESTTSPWTASGDSSFTVSNSQANTGSSSALLTPDGTSASCYIESEGLPVTPAQVVSVSANVRPTNDSYGLYLMIYWSNSSGGFISSSASGTFFTPAQKWTPVTFSAAAPATAASMAFLVVMGNTPTTDQLIYIDNCSVSIGVQVAGGVGYGLPGADGSVWCQNDGTAPADITFTLSGILTNPQIIRDDTYDILTYNGVVGETDSLVIDTASGNVTINGYNRRPLLNAANWFTIPAKSGIKVILRSANSTDNGYLKVEYSASY